MYNSNKQNTQQLEAKMLIYLNLIDTEENKSKFEQIYDTYKKTMFYAANNILNNHAQSEDVVHTSFIKIIDNLDKIDDIYCNKTKSFIVTITKNTAIDEYRKNKKEGEKVEKVIERLTNSYMIETNEETEVLTRLEMAIRELPDKYKIVFSLKYTQGYDYDEIGKLLNIKPATARSRVLRGKEKLKKILDGIEGV